MSSQLWQRLRAARKFADLTQANLAAACGITRSGYAFFEAGDPNSRTRPNTDQIMAIAKLTKVPIEWLLNDSVDPGDVWKVGVVANAGPKPLAPAPGPHPLRRSTDGPDRMEETFWRAVEYHVLVNDPSRASAFDVEVHPAPLPMRARYLHEWVISCFTTRCDPDTLSLYMGRLLLNERALGKAFRKHLLIWPRGCELDMDGTVECAQKGFAISIRQVATPEEAAAYLLSQK